MLHEPPLIIWAIGHGCPVCGASPRRRCKTGREEYHQERVALAKAAEQQEYAPGVTNREMANMWFSIMRAPGVGRKKTSRFLERIVAADIPHLEYQRVERELA